MFNENGYIDLLGPTHIVYIVAMLALIVAGIYFLKKVKNKIRVIRILGVILLVLSLLNRYDCTVRTLEENNYNYFILLPHSFCSLTSIVLSVFAIFYKKSNPVIESLFVFSLFGGLSNIFYPTYLATQYIWEIRTWTGLFHHAVSAFLMLYLLCTGEIKPSIKKWFYFPICAVCMLGIGYFELYVLGISDSMNIDSPAISSLPGLTGGWMLCLWLFIAYMLFLIIYELIKKKRKS